MRTTAIDPDNYKSTKLKTKKVINVHITHLSSITQCVGAFLASVATTPLGEPQTTFTLIFIYYKKSVLFEIKN